MVCVLGARVCVLGGKGKGSWCGGEEEWDRSACPSVRPLFKGFLESHIVDFGWFSGVLLLWEVREVWVGEGRRWDLKKKN